MLVFKFQLVHTMALSPVNLFTGFLFYKLKKSPKWGYKLNYIILREIRELIKI